MDWLKVKNPITHRTLGKALLNLERKGYFTGEYPEETHIDDPDVLTVVITRNLVATRDFITTSKRLDKPTDSTLKTHFPSKPQQSTMRSLSKVLRKRLKAVEPYKQHQTKKEEIGQLSLFDSVANKLDAQLRDCENLQERATAAYCVGDLSQDDYIILDQYFHNEIKYYQGKIDNEPKIPEKDNNSQYYTKIISLLKIYYVPKFA